MLLGAEIVLFILGIYALIMGKFTWSKTIKLRGKYARIVGLILLSPIVLALLFGTFIGILIGVGALPESAVFISTAMEILLIVGALVIAYYYSKTHAIEQNEEMI